MNAERLIRRPITVWEKKYLRTLVLRHTVTWLQLQTCNSYACPRAELFFSSRLIHLKRSLITYNRTLTCTSRHDWIESRNREYARNDVKKWINSQPPCVVVVREMSHYILISLTHVDYVTHRGNLSHHLSTYNDAINPSDASLRTHSTLTAYRAVYVIAVNGSDAT